MRVGIPVPLPKPEIIYPLCGDCSVLIPEMWNSVCRVCDQFGILEVNSEKKPEQHDDCLKVQGLPTREEGKDDEKAYMED